MRGCAGCSPVLEASPCESSSVGRITIRLARSFDRDQLAIDRAYIELDVADELGRYEAGRRQHVRILQNLEQDEWQRVGSYSEHGPISVDLYETHVAAKDVDHLAQIARLVTALP